MTKIAIVRRNGLGDLLCAWPLVLYLQKAAGEVTLFVSESNAPLIPYLSPAVKCVVLPSSGNKYLSHFKTALRFRGSFDLAISAKTSPMKLMNFFLFAMGAKRRIAYVEKGWHRFWVNRPLEYREEEAKRSHQALKCLQTIAPHLKEVPPDLYPSILLSDPLKKKRKELTLLINASTTRLASRFNEKRYAGLLNLLSESHPFTVLITGQKKDEERAKTIQKLMKIPTELVFPRNFEEFMVTLDAGDLFFVPDGGVAHIGAALKKKGVVLYGETNPIELGASQSRHGDVL